MTAILLAALTTLSLAGDFSVVEVDKGLYASADGVAYLTTATEDGWYVEAMDRSGELLLDRHVVGGELSAEHAVLVAQSAQAKSSGTLRVQLTEDREVQATIRSEDVAVVKR
ncbi:MAG: hypothetical protein KC912_16250 [Proteobacteria bacterium]|nr:hypothetical protein [Pseudomonadota bacterium]